VEGDGIGEVAGDVGEASPDGRGVHLSSRDVPQLGTTVASLNGAPSSDKDMWLCTCRLRASLDGWGGSAVAIDDGICQALMEIFQLTQMGRKDIAMVAEGLAQDGDVDQDLSDVRHQKQLGGRLGSRIGAGRSLMSRMSFSAVLLALRLAFRRA
jgi:hypothetical protein